MVEETFKNLVAKTFGPSTQLTDDEYQKLSSLTQIFNIDLDDLFLEWESYNVAEVQQDLELNMATLIQFHEYLQKKLANNKLTPKSAHVIKDGSARKPLSKRASNNNNSPATPHAKKRKFDSSEPDLSSPANFHSDNNTIATSPIKPSTVSHTLLETLNAEVDADNNLSKESTNNPIKLTANFDPSKFKFRTMQMKLLESADVLDDQIDSVARLYQESNKSHQQFGNPCLSSQFDILCCGRIVPDSPTYDNEALNSNSLFLETSRISGIGQRVPLELSKLPGYSFFPGQVVVLKGRNPTGKHFVVDEVMALPQLGTPVTSRSELQEFNVLQDGHGVKVLVASGPFSNSNRLQYSKLESLVDKINNEILPNVVILNGPFLDLTNKEVEEGRFNFPKDQNPKNLDDVFRLLITPILKKIDSKIQVVLFPSLRDSCVNHCSYPQDSFDRKRFQLPKNVKVFPNPSSFAINEVLIGSSNLDLFKDLKEVFKQDERLSRNRFDRIIDHLLEQRRYYPVMPGSISRVKEQDLSQLRNGAAGEDLNGVSVGGSSLEAPYLGLTELGDSLPDVLILPSELKVFAKVVNGVVVINPGSFVRPSKSMGSEDGTYAVLRIAAPQVDAEDGSNHANEHGSINLFMSKRFTTCNLRIGLGARTHASLRYLHSTFRKLQLIEDAKLPIATDDYLTTLVPKKLHPGLETILANANRPIQLRDYQEDAVQAVLNKLASGVKKPAVVIATGGGKTVVFSHLIPYLKPLSKERGNKVLILAHTEELIDQAARSIRLMNPGLKVDVEMRKLKASPEAEVVVASVPSLVNRRRFEKFEPIEFKSIIIDECHHAPAITYRKVLNHFHALDSDSTISVIGFTATLMRHDKQSLGHIFDEIVYERSLKSMIKSKELADAKISEVKVELNLDKVKTVRNEYDPASLYTAMKEIDFNEKIVLAYLRLKKEVDCKSTLIFCVGVEHCYEVCALFQSHGINAQYVTGETSKVERAVIIEDFKRGLIPVLCNVQVFTEGTDMPNIDSLILARPTMSKSLMIQMIGRGLRLHKEKTHCHIVDMVELTRQGIDIKPTLEGENLVNSRKKMLERDDESDLTVPSPHAQLSSKDREIAIARILEYHKKEILTLDKRPEILQTPAIWFQDREIVDKVMLRNKHPWTMIEASKTWGLPGLHDSYFILKRTMYKGERTFEVSRHSFSSSLGSVVYRGANLLKVFAELQRRYSDHLDYAEKRNSFARKATPKQVGWIMAMMEHKIGFYMQRKGVDVSKEEFKELIAEVLKDERQAIICRFIFALRLGDNDYEKMKCAQVVNNAAKRINDETNKDTNTEFVNKSNHTNNWAVLVSTSRFWFNYRHMANVLSFYRTVKRLGIPDSQIILMLSDDVACNARNAFPGTVFNNMDQALDLYGSSIEVDYRGYEVTVENFIRLLTDRWGPEQPRSKRLLTDENSNIFIYLTGHGGNEFLKFQDAEEIGAHDIADAFAQMHEKKRYNEIFFMIDTCQANTMYEHIYSPNILCIGSSKLDESSYSHHSDLDIGVAVIDRFTFFALDFLEKIKRDSKQTMDKLFEVLNFENVHSHTGIRTDLFKRNVSEVLLTDFFGNVQNIAVDVAPKDILNATKQVYPSTTSFHIPNHLRPRVEAEFGIEEEDSKQLHLSKTSSTVLGFSVTGLLFGLWKYFS
ncbi:irc3 [Candida theae]|uniref:Irc3 n=1 Tax=Candida theae TaxID=1198502 RepID=A0AAD5BF52_9ASCO|nr:irc3 [Candida theae]KAI5958078.1 irc3 [Candida theae]